jgi:hypothetical protein
MLNRMLSLFLADAFYVVARPDEKPLARHAGSHFFWPMLYAFTSST